MIARPLAGRLVLLSALLCILGVAAGSARAAEPFGISSFSASLSSSQAGGHPDFTTSFRFASHLSPEANEFLASREPNGEPRDIAVELPPGLIGSETAVPECPSKLFIGTGTTCPSATQIGVAKEIAADEAFVDLPVVSLTHGAGEAARIGIEGVDAVQLVVSVRTGGDYGLTTTSNNSPKVKLLGVDLTLWGVPAAHERGCEESETVLPAGEPPYEYFEIKCLPETPPSPVAQQKPFLTNGTDCGVEEAAATLTANSYEAPDESVSATVALPVPTGCEAVPFAPTLSVAPESTQAGEPTGYEVDLSVPQDESPTGLGSADLRNASVTFPAGTVVSPSAANGQGACTLAEIGLHDAQPVTCPADSRIASVEIETPLLGEPLRGALYQAQQAANPFGSLLATYLVAEASGVLVKLAGEIQTDPVTGQVTTTFAENPQLPFSNLRFHVRGGSRAPLANPRTCGEAVTTSKLAPWSGSGEIDPTSSFTVTGCGPLTLAPSLEAGTTGNQAGAYSPLTFSISRGDSEDEFASLAVTLPPGLLAKLRGVPLCEEPDAAAGTCPAASEIGTTTVASGPGATPVWLPVPGQPANPVYLTSGYKGAPFGLSVVVPAIAGPFNLGTVVVRAAVRIDPATAQVTVQSDPLPTILDGIPLQVRTIRVATSRPEFTFNPTSCAEQSVRAAVTGLAGASAVATAPFEAANCAALPFKPTFSLSSAGHASKANGASLTVHVTSGPGQANIAKTVLTLPEQLPSRLETLQKACRVQVFEANRASCPADSVIGTGTAKTPILAGALSGPAYLVSHGGAEFPDVEFVLQGENITIVLDGKTRIRNDVTTSSFNSVPDAPIESFEAVFPEGPHSILGTTVHGYNLCNASLHAPTVITGQNGAVITQETPVAITGCPALEIRRSHLVKGAVVLTVRLARTGAVTVRGRGLRNVRRVLAGGTHQIRVPLGHARGSRRGRRVKITVAMSSAGLSPIVRSTYIRL